VGGVTPPGVGRVAVVAEDGGAVEAPDQEAA
jgi:hypothetical protein